MAWTQPTSPYFSVGEIVTATKMNVLSDDLRYLKGVDGPTTLEDRLTLPLTASGNGKGLRFAASGTDYAALQALDLSSTSYFFFGTNRQFDGSAWQQLNSRAGGFIQIAQDNITFQQFATSSTTALERLRVDSSGYIGIGTGTPQGKLHILGGNVTTAGFLFISAVAVTSIQTIAAAGTVSRAAQFFGFDRNNTGGALQNINFAIPINTSTTYVNSDTIQVAITASGAITVQRTAGTNGTHDISLIVILM